MTTQHREDWLTTEGWKPTERGHIRGPEFGQLMLTYMDFQQIVKMPRRRLSNPSRKFRRLPIARNPNTDVLTGWFATNDDMAGGTLTEQWGIAARASDRSISVEEYQRLLVDFWIEVYPRNKRRGWDKFGNEIMEVGR